jgi:hypothetical protein
MRPIFSASLLLPLASICTSELAMASVELSTHLLAMAQPKDTGNSSRNPCSAGLSQPILPRTGAGCWPWRMKMNDLVPHALRFCPRPAYPIRPDLTSTPATTARVGPRPRRCSEVIWAGRQGTGSSLDACSWPVNKPASWVRREMTRGPAARCRHLARTRARPPGPRRARRSPMQVTDLHQAVPGDATRSSGWCSFPGLPHAFGQVYLRPYGNQGVPVQVAGHVLRAVGVLQHDLVQPVRTATAR